MSIFDINDYISIDNNFLVNNGFIKSEGDCWVYLFAIFDLDINGIIVNSSNHMLIYDFKEHKLMSSDNIYNIDDGNELLFILDKLTNPKYNFVLS